MARVNVDQEALSDARYELLARLLGINRHEALGRMIVVWNACQEREVFHLSGVLLAAMLDNSSAGSILVTAELARDEKEKGYYICGSRERTGWLRERRKEGRRGGLLGGRPRVSTVNPRGLSVETPPAPAPALSESEVDPDASTESGDRERRDPRLLEDATPAVLTFPVIGKGARTWDLTAGQMAEWVELYPGLGVADECRKALAWVRAGRPKTARGMRAFLVNWLNRATNGHSGKRRDAETVAERSMRLTEGWDKS